MFIRKWVMITVVLLSAHVTAEGANLNDTDKSISYDEAVALGQCAGMFKFMSIVLNAQGKKYQSEDASQKSNGWRIATMGALYTAGWKGESIARTMNSIYEGALSQWLAKAESGSKTISEEIESELTVCLSHNESQEQFRKLFKMVTSR